jgi:REP element-mobilizing transposase RayT
MSNNPRVAFENATYHITSRGNNRQTIFHNNNDFIIFLMMLSSIIVEHDWCCFSFCLMNNHYHLVLQTPKPNLAKGMHKLHCKYSNYYRHCHSFTGKMFEGRYDSQIICDDSYVLEAIRYDLLNPVRAGLVKQPQDWWWSSYHETSGLVDKDNSFVDSEWVKSLFDDHSTPCKSFIDFINDPLCPSPQLLAKK